MLRFSANFAEVLKGYPNMAAVLTIKRQNIVGKEGRQI
jgi:hypothetical protein